MKCFEGSDFQTPLTRLTCKLPLPQVGLIPGFHLVPSDPLLSFRRKSQEGGLACSKISRGGGGSGGMGWLAQNYLWGGLAHFRTETEQVKPWLIRYIAYTLDKFSKFLPMPHIKEQANFSFKPSNFAWNMETMELIANEVSLECYLLQLE